MNNEEEYEASLSPEEREARQRRISRGIEPTRRWPDRIDPFLEELRIAWQASSSQRFGQLCENLGLASFFIEDDEALRILKAHNDSGDF